MDASTNVLALMPPRDSTHVNNCKVHFKNFNVLRVFWYHNVKKGWGDQGRGEIICQMGGSNKMLELHWKLNIVLLRNEFE